MTEVLFTLKDAEEMERKYGVAYIVTTDRRSMMPATHVGPDCVGVITTTAGGELVNWKIWNAAGELLLHSTERNYKRTRAGWIGATKLAIEALRRQGCEHRIRPGAKGPWGAGAAAA